MSMDSQTSSLANQMKHRDREMVPRILVQAMFGLMFAAVALVAFATLTDRPKVGVVEQSPVVQERVVLLDGQRNGIVTVRDADGTAIASSTEKRKGFIGVIWRSIARERMTADVAATGPVRVVRRENGRVAVIDPSTGWSIDLIGYGKDNVAAFATLLD